MSEALRGDESTIIGQGEFELHDVHVLATVEVRGDTITSIHFAFVKGGEQPGAGDIVSLLQNKTVSKALEVKAESERAAAGNRVGITANEVLLEAFHRAVEACLAQQ
ncbi:MAG: hypothetical protein PHU25_06390 [Deltaproteobacteria bacterium]|nr:hypothetical protein [Deltaproteobacteria bacterium]